MIPMDTTDFDRMTADFARQDEADAFLVKALGRERHGGACHDAEFRNRWVASRPFIRPAVIRPRVQSRNIPTGHVAAPSRRLALTRALFSRRCNASGRSARSTASRSRVMSLAPSRPATRRRRGPASKPANPSPRSPLVRRRFAH